MSNVLAYLAIIGLQYINYDCTENFIRHKLLNTEY